MNNLLSILAGFMPISLDEMNHVELLDRVDTKFVINEEQLLEYLAAIDTHYKVLVISGKSVHPYETLYFDTADFQLYQMHHNGKLNRFKLRCRKYTDSGAAFFEIKSKTNTHRTVKRRIPVASIPEILDEPLNEYIRANTPGELKNYVPSLRVYFDRLTLVSNEANERLTFDTNLRYLSHGQEKKIRKMVIVEIKQEKHSVSPFGQLMKLNRQHKNYISKYCMGVACLNKSLKANHFKQKINALNKLGYDIH